MLQTFKNGQTSVVLRVKLLNSSVSTGAGLTGLTSASSGLIIGTIADVEATATAYTVAGSTIETITTLGTFAAPTATKCRFKEVDATNHPGVYELHFADARFAVSNAKSLLVSLSGATNLAQADFVIQLQTDDPYVAKISSGTGSGQLSVSSGLVRLSATGVTDISDPFVARGTVGSSSTTTSIVSSACSPAGAVADQFKGRIMIFSTTTATTALRGQATDITASSNSATPTFTVTALTTAPSSGDTFTIV